MVYARAVKAKVCTLPYYPSVAKARPPRGLGRLGLSKGSGGYDK